MGNSQVALRRLRFALASDLEVGQGTLREPAAEGRLAEACLGHRPDAGVDAAAAFALAASTARALDTGRAGSRRSGCTRTRR